MDNFCIRHGTLLDHRGVATLQHPEMHTCVRLNDESMERHTRACLP